MTESHETGTGASGQYVVVARRYRPQSFLELVGQRQVSQALANAINTNRVGHAYLFTGARGVGKTSTARILAKCLNCVHGPTPTPCGRCDSCLGIAAGEDVDVLEIDGASNRGIDEIRQLRSNVNIRPSRSRFKIYIIDEVHMLTTQAFNALLKTLEEPPEHVKFIFCTTDPEKIPITVLSRCQRFDFAGIATDEIVGRLRAIVDAEGVSADDEALALLARRAGGSMRDSQSLLEQLLAFGGDRLTIESVHGLLGTASSGRVTGLVQCCLNRDAAGALAELAEAMREGVEASHLIEQLLGYFRDMMAAAVGCPVDAMLHISRDEYPQLVESASAMGLENILASIQILDQAIVRMRVSTQVRPLAETALVRLCHLEKLNDLATLVQQVQSSAKEIRSPISKGSSTPGVNAESSQKKTTDPAPVGLRIDRSHRTPTPAAPPRISPSNLHSPLTSSAPPVHACVDNDRDLITSRTGQSAVHGQSQQRAVVAVTGQNAMSIWRQALARIEGMTAMHAGRAASIAISGPNRLAIGFPASYTSSRSYCERPLQRQELETALAAVVGESIRIEFRETSEPLSPTSEPVPTQIPQAQLKKQVATHPVVSAAMELFDGTVIAVERASTTTAASGDCEGQ
jgi:DNA polymerase-3 subunit gamma/tau